MLDNRWDPLPYPYMAIATAHAIDPDEWLVVLNRVLEDVTGEAGVLASAVRDPRGRRGGCRLCRAGLGRTPACDAGPLAAEA